MMKPKQHQKTATEKNKQKAAEQKQLQAISRRRLWLFRLSAAVLIPAVLLVALEIGLRICDFGYPADFIVQSSVVGTDSRTENRRFGWRVFPKQMARAPVPFVISAVKKPNTYRIFIFGASAAQGVPEASYSFGRILECMLRDQYPSVEFEVINTAMTAINSHVVLEIAKDCSQYQGDLFIVYLGNNEVVGPYGPGTIFAPFSKSLFAIRTGLKLQSTRVGQLLRHARSFVAGGNTEQTWGGMEMFMERQVTADNPAMTSVYHNFKQNLTDICRVARNSSSQIIVATVATNVKDCPPFMSQHRGNLSKDELRKWENNYEQGISLEESGEYEQAIQAYLSAAETDDRFADLQYRLGHCYWRLEEYDKARDRYVLARNNDTLRFRADSRINEIIREVAADAQQEDAHLVDAVKAFEKNSPGSSPGQEFFLEQAHMNFSGNYLLAKTVFEKVVQILPSWVQQREKTEPVLTESQCVEYLALTSYDRHRIAEDMLFTYIKRPPFTNQLYHAEHVARLEEELKKLKAYEDPDRIAEADLMYREAIRRWNGDVWLHFNYGTFLLNARAEPATAAAELSIFRQKWPHYNDVYSRLGTAMLMLREYDLATKYFRQALRLRANDNPFIRNHLGLALQLRGDLDEAIVHHKRALQLNPDDPMIYNNLGMVMAKKRTYGEAVKYFEQAVRLAPDSVSTKKNLELARELMRQHKNRGDSQGLQDASRTR